jgi:glycosyltransferase involved in cell wall biosynthesis
MTTTRVTVIIPTYNRFDFLVRAIHSVKTQTHKDIEIIVINDGSTEEKYYSETGPFEDLKVIHLNEDTCSRKVVGFPCGGYARNIGMKEATGEYIAFLDDDDIWFPKKIESQLQAMKETGCEMSSTEGLIGFAPIYDPGANYQRYNHVYWCMIIIKYQNKKSDFMKDNKFPRIWSKQFLSIHNCCITSSVIVKTDLLKKINYMKHLHQGHEDYDCWLRALEHTDCVYIDDIHFYYYYKHT